MAPCESILCVCEDTHFKDQGIEWMYSIFFTFEISLKLLTMISLKLLKKYPTTFWVANAMELFERWAWYGFYLIFALYLTNSTDEGALGFSQTQKGLIMGIGTAFLYLLPIFTGAFSDRIGYRKTLYSAYII